MSIVLLCSHIFYTLLGSRRFIAACFFWSLSVPSHLSHICLSCIFLLLSFFLLCLYPYD
ncbi:hypothetical protein R3P38DRAFT_2869644, partial [Favolaschia claudopus]